MFFRFVCLCILSMTSVCAKDPSVSLKNPWARPADVGYNSALYLSLTNESMTPLVIVGASFDGAKKVELHETVEVEGISKMIPMNPHHPWTLAPGDTLTLAPGAKHVMLIGLTHPLETGRDVRVTLMAQDGAKIDVDARVQKKPQKCTECCGH